MEAWGNQEIKQDNLKTQIVSAITDLEGDRDLVDFGKENKTIDLMSPPQAKSPTPRVAEIPAKQVNISRDEIISTYVQYNHWLRVLSTF